jgi:rubrerythrin
MGMNNDGEVVAASNSSLFLYFEWSMDENGMYDVFASVVNDEELEEIMADFDAEVEDDESELNESIAEKTKMLYKLVNKMNAEKQMSEMPMPDLKKKMSAKKATLPNMMKEDDMNKFDDDDKPRKKEKVREYEHETSQKRIMHTGTPPKGYKLVKKK